MEQVYRVHLHCLCTCDISDQCALSVCMHYCVLPNVAKQSWCERDAIKQKTERVRAERLALKEETKLRREQERLKRELEKKCVKIEEGLHGTTG